MHVLETLIGAFCGALFAFVFGITTKALFERIERKRRVKLFISYLQENQKALTKIRSELICALETEDSESIRVALKKMGYVQNGEYKLFSIQDEHRKLAVDIKNCKYDTIQKIKRIVNAQEYLYLKQSNQFKSGFDLLSDVPDSKMISDAERVIREIDEIDSLISKIEPDLEKHGYWKDG